MQIRNLIPVAAFIAIVLKQAEAIATAFIFRTGFYASLAGAAIKIARTPSIAEKEREAKNDFVLFFFFLWSRRDLASNKRAEGL